MSLSFAVVTPSFQQARFLERTIRSVLSQNYPGLDYWVIDGGSTDGSVDILKRYDGQIHWVSEPDGGQSEAVNRGIRASRGDIIGWLNSDDVYYPGALQSVAAHFDAHPEADAIYGKAHHIDVDDAVIEEYPTEDWNAARMREFCFICQPALFLRRSSVERFGLLAEELRYSMDYEYWLRLAQGGAKFLHIPDFLAGSRLHDETKTLGSRVKVHAEINSMFVAKTGSVPDTWIYNYVHAAVRGLGLSPARPFAFGSRLAWESCKADLRWRKRITWPVLRQSVRWLVENHYRGVRGALGL